METETLARYERAYGNEYTETKGMSITQIAAHVRRNIKAQASLWATMPPYKFSVKCSRGRAINVTVTIPDEIDALAAKFESENDARYGGGWNHFQRVPESWLVDEFSPLADLKKVLDTVRVILNAPNYDGSDAMVDYSDVRYYGSVRYKSESSLY